MQRGPRAERAVTGHELRLVHATVAQIAEHGRPRVLALAVAVLDREQLLAAVLADADHDQQAQPRVLAEADTDVHAVDEQVGIPVESQLPGPERGVLGLPLLGQPLDRTRRQPRGVLAQQIPQRRPEVPGREPVQVQDRQHLGDLRRPSGVRRQDPRAEPLALPTLIIDALVVHPRRVDRDRTRAHRHPPLSRAAVADDQPLAVLIDLVHKRSDVLINLGLERRADHPTRALTSKIIERDPTLVLLPDGEPANI